MDDVDCVRIHVPDKSVQAYSMLGDSCIGPITAPITINQTISCCHDGMNCTAVFAGIQQNDTNYGHTNCAERDELAPVVEDVVDCYGTDEYMKCKLCLQ